MTNSRHLPIPLVVVLAALLASLPAPARVRAAPVRAHPVKAAPPPPPAEPAAAIAANAANGNQYAFWRTTSGHIEEAWDNGSWHGPVNRGWSSDSAPGAAVNSAGHQFIVWEGPHGDIFEVAFTGHWQRAEDLTRNLHWGNRGTTTAAPAVAVDPGSDHVFLFWRGPDGRVREAWNDGQWHGPINHGWTTGTAPSAAVSADGHRYVLWRAPTTGDLIETSDNGGGWSHPQDLSRTYHWGVAGRSSSSPSLAVDPNRDYQYVFWRGRGNRVYETWNTGRWHGPSNRYWSAGSAPSAAIGAAGHQYVLWLGGGTLFEAWYAAGWTGPVGRWKLAVGRGAYAEVTQTTANLAQRLTPLSDVQFSSARLGRVPTITVDDGVRYQRVKGVGAAMTDSAAWLIQDNLSPANRTMLMNDLFTSSGIHMGFTLIPMGGSDFSVGGRPYTYDDLPSGQSDASLAQFSIAHDQSYILPLLRQMLALAPGTETFAVPWSPPPWMKANDSLGDINHQGTLLPGAYGPLASYFVKFLQAYAQQGVPIDAIAPENEPRAASAFPAMYFPEPNEAQWIAGNLAPALSAAGLDPRIYGSDTSWQLENYAQALATGPARAALAGLAWHCYGGIPTVMNDLHTAAASLDQIVTECAPNLSHYAAPEIVIGSLRNWASEVTLWNVATDPAGGPVEPPNSGCHGCRGLVTINESTHALTFNPDYYELGQVGDFVQSGAWRIASNSFVTFNQSASGYGTSGSVDDVAVRNPDGSRTLIAYNTGAAAAHFAVRWRGAAFAYTLPAEATVTFRWNP